MALITHVYKLHEDTPFDASTEELNGNEINSESYEAMLIWFEPYDAYDGVAYIEISPDGGKTWLLTSYRPLDDLSTHANTVTFDGSDEIQAITIILFEVVDIRARLEGGSAGSVTVKARLTDGRY